MSKSSRRSRGGRRIVRAPATKFAHLEKRRRSVRVETSKAKKS